MALKIFSKHKPGLNFRSARLNGKKMAIKINTNRKNVQVTILGKILYIGKNKKIIETSPFFYE